MITNHILEEKYRVQRQLAEEAGYDMAKYEQNLQTRVAEIEQKYGIIFKYGAPALEAEECLSDQTR